MIEYWKKYGFKNVEEFNSWAQSFSTAFEKTKRLFPDLFPLKDNT